MKGEKILPVTRPTLPAFEEYCEEIRSLWESRWLTNMGEKHEAFRTQLEELLGVPHVSLTTNGHLALENALTALALPKGSEVITTPFTFASTTHALQRAGLTPVFCDIRWEDMTLDPDKVEPLISERTSALLPVHVYGQMCDVDALERIARRRGLRIVYDAAHAFGARLRGRSAASFGDASIFSFHATKVFHTIEGGAVCFRDDALRQKLDDLKNFGIRDEEHIEAVGGNAKMSEFQAAMGLCNLRRLDEAIARRRALFERYGERLADLEGIRLPPSQRDVQPNYGYFPVLFEGGLSRDEACAHLADRGILCRKYFYPLTSACPAYAHLPTARPGATPIAERVSRQVLCLPLYADMAEEDVDRVADALKELFRRRAVR